MGYHGLLFAKCRNARRFFALSNVRRSSRFHVLQLFMFQPIFVDSKRKKTPNIDNDFKL
jgi:hypothetical protein